MADGASMGAPETLAALAEGHMQCAVTGAAFEVLLQHGDMSVLEAVMRSAVVFSRMQPHQKGQVVDLLGTRGIHQLCGGEARHIQVLHLALACFVARPFACLALPCCDSQLPSALPCPALPCPGPALTCPALHCRTMLLCLHRPCRCLAEPLRSFLLPTKKKKDQLALSCRHAFRHGLRCCTHHLYSPHAQASPAQPCPALYHPHPRFGALQCDTT